MSRGYRLAGPLTLAVLAVGGTVRADDGYMGLDAGQLAKECDAGTAMSCEVLGDALSNGNSMVRGARKDPALGLTYWIKGCNLGEPMSCFGAGNALWRGKGVDKDEAKALPFLKQTCESDGNVMQPWGCVDAAYAMLDIAFVDNYPTAMQLFDNACNLNKDACDAKSPYAGTGLKSAGDGPSGAVGFQFGISRKDAEKRCKTGKGKIKKDPGDEDAFFCDEYYVDTLREASIYTLLKFCNKALCDVDVVLDGGPRYVQRYYDLKHRLTETYKAAGKITFRWPADCKVDSDIAKCIHDGKIALSSTWQWDNDTLLQVLVVASDDGTVGINIGYASAEGIKAIDAIGL